MFQAVPGFETGLNDITEAPFICHSQVSPVLVFRQTRSALLSLLKSAPATIVQGGTCVPIGARLVTVPPLIVHSQTSPVVPLRQIKSALPSPLKSAAAAMLHAGAIDPSG